ncbi:MAG: hypothetical protein LBV72_00930 [Tannerella sp.]|jgi:C-terminal processing protease CtpA/Prc|nr:hypothetical protein [Tannerella sp.]
MMYRKYLFFLLTCLFLNACSDDNNEPGVGGGDEDRPETLAWIEDTMRQHYLWNDKIKKAGELNYTADPETFFTSLLYKNEDGKTGASGNHHYYSYIEKATVDTRSFTTEDYTYGFEFTTVVFNLQGSTTKIIGALILYLLPGTPAEEAGLKRGDWIIGIDNNPITTQEDVMSLLGGTEKTFTIAQWDSKTNGFINSRHVPIGTATSVDYNPILTYDVIPRAGKQVGYLVYDRFMKGIDNDNTVFDDQLRTLSSGLFSGVNEFVLDLRYNNGGLLSCVQLLCAILGPDHILTAKRLGYLQYNDDSTGNFTAGKSHLGSTGKNLNLRRLFVLVSSTSASASEAVINLLDPFMEVIVIGEQTEGKNVASAPFTSDDKIWEMHPITSKIFNSADKSDYSNGWRPNVKMGDTFDYDDNGDITSIVDIYGLGDPNERLLKTALEIIDGKSYDEITTKSYAYPIEKVLGRGTINSLDRKATNGVIIDIDQ